MKMETLRFSYNPSTLVLSAKRKLGLRIGYMEAALTGFCLNSLETGVSPEKTSAYLLDHFNCKDADTTLESFRFLLDEGDRTSYNILLPHLLSAENLIEFEQVIRERFFGVDRFVQQGKNLFNFLQFIEKRKDPIIWINDLERGIIGWDMGKLVGLVRAAREKEYINRQQAWGYIEQANKLCSKILQTTDNIDKSFLIGQAMKSNKIEDWEQLAQCYSLLNLSGH